jgi:hypothetical protein
MGFVIDSPALVQALAKAFDVDAPRAAYELLLAPDGRALEWVERTAEGEARYDVEPATSWALRSKVERSRSCRSWLL